VPENRKNQSHIRLSAFELRFVLGKLYVIGDYEVHQRLFEQKIQFRPSIWVRSGELDA
jgi:hypothetical protein